MFSYRKLSQFGQTLFAARDDGERGLHFVTWQLNDDHTNPNNGHYSDNYDWSKQGIPLSASITYSNGYTTNETGEFFAAELWYDNSVITATASFSDGTVRTVEIWVDVSIISFR